MKNRISFVVFVYLHARMHSSDHNFKKEKMPGLLTRFKEYLRGRKVSEVIIDPRCPHYQQERECIHRVTFVYKNQHNGSESRYVEWLYGFEILHDYYHYTTKSQRDHMTACCYTEIEKKEMKARSPSRYLSLFEGDD